MKTPAGFECKYFYGDYYRYRNHEECRLIGTVPPPRNWTPDLCSTCPVPAILRANACPNMVLTAAVKPGFLKIGRGVKITAFCTKSRIAVKEPEIGCGSCHTIPEIKPE